jgi:trimeric autotransporter adhesin
MSAVALYTYSKSIDNDSNQAQDPFNLNLERALSNSDQRQRLNVTYTASSPVGVRGLWRNAGWKTRMLSGWTTGGGFTYATGMPLTPTVGGTATSSLFYLRANTTGAPLYASGYPFFNLAAFSTAPPVDEYGDAGRNIITGVPTLSLNAQLNRVWRFGESRKQIQLQFRTNNVLNHVYINSFGTVVNSSTYGEPTGASGTRTVTCILRFNF